MARSHLSRLDAAALRALLAIALLATGSPAALQAQPARFGLRFSGGLGVMTSPDQTGRLGFDELGLVGSAIAGVDLVPRVTLEARLGGGWFFSDSRGDGGLGETGAGLRFGVPLSPRLDLQLAAHASAAFTGPELLPSFDLGAALVHALDDDLSAGIELTYDHLLWTDGEGYSSDARSLALSAVIAWRPRAEAPPAPPARARRRPLPAPRVVHHTVERWRDPPAPPPAAVEIERLLDEALPVTSREEILLIPPVLFAHDSARVLPAGEVALHAARELIAEMPGTVVIEGHADGSGTDAYNAELSLARAMAVHQWLVAHGIDGARLEVEAHGEHRPLAGEDAPRRQLDRRVTFRTVRP